MRRNEKELLKLIIFVIGIVLLAALLILGFRFIEKLLDGRDAADTDDYLYSDDGGIFYEGGYYVPRKDILTVLVLGIDSVLGSKSRQADFISLLVVDEANESFSILHINRDTVTEVIRLDEDDRSLGPYKAQIALAHTHGTTEEKQCRNTRDAVEGLLYGIDIDHYVSVTMDAVPVINDAAGGVTLELMDDMTQYKPEFKKGERVTLWGEDALYYVRARSELSEPTNLHRMERQRQYISALFDKLMAQDAEMSAETALKLGEYLTTDYTSDGISRLLERIRGCEFKGILDISGEAVTSSEGYIEFYADEKDIRKKTIELFYSIKSKAE